MSKPGKDVTPKPDWPEIARSLTTWLEASGVNQEKVLSQIKGRRASFISLFNGEAPRSTSKALAFYLAQIAVVLQRTSEFPRLLNSVCNLTVAETEDLLERAARVVESRRSKPIADYLRRLVTERRVLTYLRAFSVPVVRTTVRDIGRADAPSFSKAYIRLLMGAVNPAWKAEFKTCDSIADQLRLLHDPVSPSHIGAGIFQSLRWVSEGFACTPYPGIRYAINAVELRDLRRGRALTWSEVVAHPSERHKIVAVTSSGDAADEFLRGVCGYRENVDIFPIHSHLYRQITDKLKALSVEKGDQMIIYCGDEDLCAALSVEWERLRMIAQPGDLPARLFLRAGMMTARDPEWVALLGETTQFLFEFAPEQMAPIYAQMLSEGLESHLEHVRVERVASAPKHRDRATNYYSFARLYDLGVRNSGRFLEELARLLFIRLDRFGDKLPEPVEKVIDEMLREARGRGVMKSVAKDVPLPGRR